MIFLLRAKLVGGIEPPTNGNDPNVSNTHGSLVVTQGSHLSQGATSMMCRVVQNDCDFNKNRVSLFMVEKGTTITLHIDRITTTVLN